MLINWKNKAVKQLKKIQTNYKKQIVSAVATLYNFPNVQDVKKLKNHKYGYRLKVNKYRVLFDYEDSIKIISIEEIKKRNENTY